MRIGGELRALEPQKTSNHTRPAPQVQQGRVWAKKGVTTKSSGGATEKEMREILILLPTRGTKRRSRTANAEEIRVEESGMAVTAESRKSGAGGARKREFSGRNKRNRSMRVRKSDGGTPGRIEGVKDMREIESERSRKRRLRERRSRFGKGIRDLIARKTNMSWNPTEKDSDALAMETREGEKEIVKRGRQKKIRGRAETHEERERVGKEGGCGERAKRKVEDGMREGNEFSVEAGAASTRREREGRRDGTEGARIKETSPASSTDGDNGAVSEECDIRRNKRVKMRESGGKTKVRRIRARKGGSKRDVNGIRKRVPGGNRRSGEDLLPREGREGSSERVSGAKGGPGGARLETATDSSVCEGRNGMRVWKSQNATVKRERLMIKGELKRG